MQSAKALGTEIELRLRTENKDVAESAFKIMWKKISDFENKFSRFKKDSELSIVNLNAGKKIKASTEFMELFIRAKYFYEITDSIFNPFILPELFKAGYKKSMVGNGDYLDYSNRKLSDFSVVKIDKETIYIPPDSAIDFGGIGKGYLADKLSMVLDNKFDSYCLSMGGDIILKGTWEIDIENFSNQNKIYGTWKNNFGKIGIATSSVVRKKSKTEQRHLIGPPSNYDLCTVVCSDAVTADVLASCFLLMEESSINNFVNNNLVKFVLLQGKNGHKTFGDNSGFNLVS